jgi:rubrerythrin
MNADQHRKELIHILHMAYSGELAAGIAYAGHWRSLSVADQIKSIKKIENDEWVHRRLVGEMLAELDDRPQRWREMMMAAIGSSVFIACFLGGWFMPMYFAGRLESANTKEYFQAAYHASELGLTHMQGKLMELSAVELEHEEFFKSIVQGHVLLPLMIKFFRWGEVKALLAAEQDQNQSSE